MTFQNLVPSIIQGFLHWKWLLMELSHHSCPKVVLFCLFSSCTFLSLQSERICLNRISYSSSLDQLETRFLWISKSFVKYFNSFRSSFKLLSSLTCCQTARCLYLRSVSNSPSNSVQNSAYKRSGLNSSLFAKFFCWGHPMHLATFPTKTCQAVLALS